MTHKAGLHKQVSSIFGKTPMPDSSSPLSADSPLNEPILAIDKLQTAVQLDDGLTEEERQFEASQKKKLYLVIGLSVVLALVVYMFYWPGNKKASADSQTSSQTGIAVREVDIHWPQLPPWPDNIRDPMILGSSPASTGGSFGLKGIVYLPQSRSSILIGTEIYHEGDTLKNTDWKVMKITLDSVKLQNPAGQEKEITMEGR